jgi:hypothetical protein
VRIWNLFRPAWVLQLTNADLIDAFGTALEARETRNDAPDLMRRLDILSEEISRRERSGMLTENDWIDPPNRGNQTSVPL